MAAFTNCVLGMLMLGLSAVSVTGNTDCGKECALCVYQLLGQRSNPSSLTCSAECSGELDKEKLQLCRDLLLDEEKKMLLSAEDPQQEPEGRGTAAADAKDDVSREHQAAKKYGGFLKRYGGFMSPRNTDSDEAENADEHIGFEILKLLKAEVKNGNEEGGPGGNEVKRYGGFMRRGEKDEEKGGFLDAAAGRDVSKRYGGFMRRVGRPEWLVDNSKSVGSMKRAWENERDLHKRYGGFMD